MARSLEKRDWRVIVAGSRSLDGRPQMEMVHRKLDHFFQNLHRVTIIVTCAKSRFDPPHGVEQMAAFWGVKNQHRADVEYYPTDNPDQFVRWDKYQSRVPFYPPEIWNSVQALILFEPRVKPWEDQFPRQLRLDQAMVASLKIKRVTLK